jgi:hypothetical protein
MFLWLVMFPVYWFACVPIGWAIGYKPTSFNFNDEAPFVKYQSVSLPWYGELLPYHFVVAAIIISLEWLWFHECGWKYPVFIQGGVIATFALLIGLMNYLESDFSKVVSAWFAARKQRICPIVNFTEEPTSNNINE